MKEHAKEQRLYWRISPENNITCHISNDEGKNDMENVLVADISPAGLSFICDRELPEGTELKLKVNFPSSYPEEENNVIVKVAHCYKHKDKFKIGCSYIKKKPAR